MERLPAIVVVAKSGFGTGIARVFLPSSDREELGGKLFKLFLSNG